ncbi:hypothetical protein [Ensifer adhaerens]|uniref:hypothetical protein n=1 Tax=Ensifer adhaerens TaxID=106592 RepID=UPI0019299350|nr:hypothetical protein [Ensifer adhaerens]
MPEFEGGREVARTGRAVAIFDVEKQMRLQVANAAETEDAMLDLRGDRRAVACFS